MNHSLPGSAPVPAHVSGPLRACLLGTIPGTVVGIVWSLNPPIRDRGVELALIALWSPLICFALFYLWLENLQKRVRYPYEIRKASSLMIVFLAMSLCTMGLATAYTWQPIPGRLGLCLYLPIPFLYRVCIDTYSNWKGEMFHPGLYSSGFHVLTIAVCVLIDALLGSGDDIPGWRWRILVLFWPLVYYMISSKIREWDLTNAGEPLEYPLNKGIRSGRTPNSEPA